MEFTELQEFDHTADLIEDAIGVKSEAMYRLSKIVMDRVEAGTPISKIVQEVEEGLLRDIRQPFLRLSLCNVAYKSRLRIMEARENWLARL